MEIQNILRRILKPTKLILQTLEDVNSAATAVTSKAANLLDAGHVLRLVRGRSTLSDGLGALAALAEDRAAAKLAVERVGLDARLVALDLEGSSEASGSDSESKEVLEVHFRFLFFVQHLRAHTAFLYFLRYEFYTQAPTPFFLPKMND